MPTIDMSDECQAIVRLYTIGLVTMPESSGSASRSTGSGTLVDFFGVRGILTAAHVASSLLSLKEFGILRYGGGWLQALTTRCVPFDVVSLGGESAGEHGPDVAFVALSRELEATLSATNAFFSPVARGRAMEAGESAAGQPIQFATGMIEEASRLLEAIGNQARTEHTALVGIGGVVEHDLAEGGSGTFHFSINHHAEFPAPTTYGGMSGGGVWQVRQGGGVLARNLIGVMFRESDANELGERAIICNGPGLIYDRLMLSVLERFNPAVAEVFREE